MRIKTEIDKDFTGFLITYFSGFGINMVAFEEKDEYNVLYFDKQINNGSSSTIKKKRFRLNCSRNS